MKKNMKTIFIEDEIIEYIGIKNLRENYNEFINKIKELNISENKKSYKSIFYNIQTEDVIVRNIDNINILHKKDIEGIIKYNIKQYMPINIGEYEMRYKTLNKKDNIATVQVILFPKYLVDLCKEISRVLGIKAQSINVNYDILQKLIDKNIIKNIEKNTALVEVRKNEFIINKVKNKIIIESYILPKNNYLKEHINKLQSIDTSVYHYVNEDFTNENINKIVLSSGKKSIKIYEGLNQDISRYIYSIGIVI